MIPSGCRNINRQISAPAFEFRVEQERQAEGDGHHRQHGPEAVDERIAHGGPEQIVGEQLGVVPQAGEARRTKPIPIRETHAEREQHRPEHEHGEQHQVRQDEQIRRNVALPYSATWTRQREAGSSH
jgi:hypothetical protein